MLAYPVMACLTARLISRWGRGFLRYAAAMTAALAVCYAGGTAWLAVSTGSGLWAALAAGVLPFLALDAVKIVLTAAGAASLHRALARAGLSHI